MVPIFQHWNLSTDHTSTTFSGSAFGAASPNCSRRLPQMIRTNLEIGVDFQSRLALRYFNKSDVVFARFEYAAGLGGERTDAWSPHLCLSVCSVEQVSLLKYATAFKIESFVLPSSETIFVC